MSPAAPPHSEPDAGAIREQCRRLAEDPGSASLWAALARLRLEAGAPGRALAASRRAVAADPALPAGQRGLVQALLRLDRRAEAEQAAERGLAALPEDAATLATLALLRQAQGDIGTALTFFNRAVLLAPELLEARANRARLLISLGLGGEASVDLARALAQRPGLGALHRLAEALKLPGTDWPDRAERLLAERSYAAAEVAARMAVITAPDDGRGHELLGRVLNAAQQPAAAGLALIMAATLTPDVAAVYSALGDALHMRRRIEAAITVYRRALVLEPELGAVRVNLGRARHSAGDIPGATACFQEVLRREPDSAPARLALCLCQLPIVYHDQAEISRCRSAYAEALVALAGHYGRAEPSVCAAAAEAVGTVLPFYLAYQSADDRELQRCYGELVHRLMAAAFPERASRPAEPRLQPGEPLRVGIVSGFFFRHSVWKIPLGGWMEGLDRSRFALFGYHTRAQRDDDTRRAESLCRRFVQGPLGVAEWVRQIAADRPHLLLYPEIGMDGMSTRLAGLWLAPVQVAGPGHPVTTGLPTMDYYLTSDLMEPPGAEAHYTERLVRLPNLAVNYAPAPTPPEVTTRAQLNLGPDDVLYWCCQSLYKYLPAFDHLFPRIARAVPRARFVFIAHQGGAGVTGIFRQRLLQAFAEHGLAADRHCLFLNPMPQPRFAGVAALADVFLDNPSWSGNNTVMESMAFGIPVVTLPGPFMRTRHAAAILRHLGVTDTIAATPDDYVALAVRLGRDRGWRDQISQRLLAQRKRLYGDPEGMSALAEFLVQAVEPDHGRH
jgi:predicted O-linked N-acetylglucosamine transferase (SPINDLY family)